MHTTSKITAAVLALVAGQSQARDLKRETPHLQDWFDAEWFDGVVKIPLTIEDSSLWYADLQVMDPDTGALKSGGYCFVDNNSANTLIFNGSQTTDYWL